MEAGLARELVELVREGTNLSYAESKATAAAVLGHAQAALRLPQLEQLVAALDGDVVDVEGCGDAFRLRQMLAWVREAKQDGQERSWALHDSLEGTLANLRTLSELFVRFIFVLSPSTPGITWLQDKADPRVPLAILAGEDYQPLYDLVDLYQMVSPIWTSWR